MTTLLRPGIYHEENLPLSSGVDPGDTATVAAFLGEVNRGPVVPTLVRSWPEVVRIFGDFEAGVDNYLLHALHRYFANDGHNAYVGRVTGAGAAVATRTANDSAAAAALTINAKSSGLWGNNIYYAITLAATAGYFDLTVYYGGSTDAFVVEKWSDLTMTNTDPRYAPGIINSETAGSSYITVVDEAASALATPAAAAATALTGGLNGAAAATGDFQAAITALDQIDAILVLNIPNASSAVANSALLFAENRGDVFVVIDPPVDSDAAELATFYAALTPKTTYGALYGPWITFEDPSSQARGATKLLPPGGSVVGQYAMTDTTRGVHKAPAGVTNRIAGAIDVERRFTNTELDTLNQGMINVIKPVPGNGICIMGARTLKTGRIDKYVPVRRSLIHIKRNLTNDLAFALFEPNDSELWETIEDVAESFLTKFWQEGGLLGGSATQAFYVKCDETLNTEAVVEQGMVIVEVGVALRQPAEFVVLRLGLNQTAGVVAADEADVA